MPGVSVVRCRHKAPEEIKSRGLDHLESFVGRLIDSPSEYTTLWISSFTRKPIIYLVKRTEPSVLLDIHFRGSEPARSPLCASALSGIGAEWVEDPIHSGWRVEANPDKVLLACRTAMKEVCGITDEEGLKYAFEDNWESRTEPVEKR